MIMRGGNISAIIQQQEEDEAQKLVEKEQRAMTSTPIKRALLIVQRVLSLHHFLQSSILQNLGVAPKVINLSIYSMFFFVDSLLHLQEVFRVARKDSTVDVGYNYTNLSLLGMICTNGLMNLIERITNRATANFYGLPTYYLWFLLCILCHLLFGYPLYNADSQQVNSLLSVLYTVASISLQFLCFFFQLYQATLKIMRILLNKD